MDAPLMALTRGNDILAVGKFTPEVIQQICEPGDQVVDETGRVGTYCPPNESPASSSSEAPAPQVPFTGEAHKL